MHYEELREISTPEGVVLELELAGVGSRAAAWIVDTIVQAIALLILGLALAGTAGDSASTGVLAVLFLIAAFVVSWGYFVLLETFNDGQSLGKQLVGLRVLDRNGGPVLFREAAVRNLIRPIDEGLTVFLGALISIARSRDNQRIGDHAAGTIVVHDPRQAPVQPQEELLFSERTWRLVNEASTWDTTRLSDEDLEAARRYISRRDALPPARRWELGARLAAALRAKIPAADQRLPPEQFLEALVALRSTRG